MTVGQSGRLQPKAGRSCAACGAAGVAQIVQGGAVGPTLHAQHIMLGTGPCVMTLPGDAQFRPQHVGQGLLVIIPELALQRCRDQVRLMQEEHHGCSRRQQAQGLAHQSLNQGQAPLPAGACRPAP